MSNPRLHPSFRFSAVSALVLVLIGAAPATAPRVPGVTFTTRVKMSATNGPMQEVLAAQGDGYTSVTRTANGRSRMDIVDGGMTGFAKGTYALSDTAGTIVVRPATKDSYVLSTRDMASKSMDMAKSEGMSMSLKNVVITLDTLSDGGVLDGRPTRHLRVNGSYVVGIDMSGMGIDMSDLGGMSPSIKTTLTTDYWIASIDGLPSNIAPLQSFGAGVGAGSATQTGAGFMKEFVDKLSTAVKGLPPGVPLKTVTTTRLTSLTGEPSGTDGTVEISDVKGTDVDLDQLVLPPGFTETSVPGLGQLGLPMSTDGGARWRIRPGG